MISLDEKSLLEQALKGHLASLPRGGDAPPPAVDPNNVTGVNDDKPAQEESKPEIHLATLNGPQKMSGPMDRQAFQALPRSQRAKMVGAGLAPAGVNPRSYVNPTQANANVAGVIRSNPQVVAGEAAATEPRTPDDELAPPPSARAPLAAKQVAQATPVTMPSPPPAGATAPVPPRQAQTPAAGGPFAQLATQALQRPASSEMEAAQEESAHGHRLAAIGETFDRAAHQPTNLLDFAISKAGGHPVETGPDTTAWNQIRADSDRPMAQLAQRTAMARQQANDAIGNAEKVSATSKNNAEAYKALHPDAKPPHEPLFDPAGFKSSLKQLYPDKVAQIDKLADTKDALEAAKQDYENVEQNKRGVGKGIVLLNQGASVGLGKAEQEKQIEERAKINTANQQLDQVVRNFHAVSPVDLAKSKVGYDSPSMAEFRSSALALIDKMAQVETGATGRQSQVEQWKRIIEGNSVLTNEQMDHIATGLREALGAAQTENEGRTKGLTHIGAKPSGDTEKVAPNGSKYTLHSDGSVTPHD